MSASSAPYLTGPALLDFLRETFPGRQVISSTEFRHFLNISPSTDLRMRNLGKYPRTICLPGVMRDPRILLVDLAVWLEQGGCPETEGVTYRKRGRGSDEWKKNHPPKAEAVETPSEPSAVSAPAATHDTAQKAPVKKPAKTGGKKTPSSKAASKAAKTASKTATKTMPELPSTPAPEESSPEAVSKSSSQTAEVYPTTTSIEG